MKQREKGTDADVRERTRVNVVKKEETRRQGLAYWRCRYQVVVEQLNTPRDTTAIPDGTPEPVKKFGVAAPVEEVGRFACRLPASASFKCRKRDGAR